MTSARRSLTQKQPAFSLRFTRYFIYFHFKIASISIKSVETIIINAYV